MSANLLRRIARKTRRASRTPRAWLAGGLLALGSAGLLASALGCNVIGPVVYFLGPRRIQKAEHKFVDGKIAVLVDCVRPEEFNPLFEQALIEKLITIFQERKSRASIVDYHDMVAFRRANPDVSKWSIQKIGRELGAEYVVYLRVERLQSRESPDFPVVQASVSLREKLISVSQPADKARVWPSDAAGRLVEITRQPEEASSHDVADTAMTKLGKDLAYEISNPFFDIDLEEKTPRER